MREREIRSELQASMGREPTEAELAAARDERARQQLRSELGRPPTELEVEEAKHAARTDRCVGM